MIQVASARQQIAPEDRVEHLAIMLMMVGITIYSIHVATQKWLQKFLLTPRGAIVFSNTIGLTFLLTILPWWSTMMQKLGWQTPVTHDNAMFWIGVIWATGWNIFIVYANAQARKGKVHVTLTQPFQGLTPLLIAVSAALFKEYPSPKARVGIFLIGAGTYAHGREDAVIPKKFPRTRQEWWLILRDWALPFRRAIWLPENFSTASEKERTKMLEERDAIRWALKSACAGTMGLLGDGLVARHGNLILGLTFQFGVIAAWYLILPRLWGDPEPLLVNSDEKASKYWKQILLFAVGHPLSYVLMSSSYRLTRIAHIGSLKRLNIIIVGLLAWAFLGEKKKSRLVTGSVITAGAILLGTDPKANAYVLGSAEQYFARIKGLLRL